MGLWRPQNDQDFPTLGWAVIRHAEESLIHPDGERRGLPWRWTDDQKRHILRAYQLNPDTGQRLYRRSCLIRPKKWGKGPFVAALALCEATGPVRFAGWNDAGRPIAVRVQEAKPIYGGGWTPWVQALGTSEAQTNNVWVPLMAMLPFLSETTGIAVDAGQTRVLLDNGASGRIEPVTSSATSREGQPITFGGCDETWQWVHSNGGLLLARTVRRNVSGTSGWICETTNAPAIGSGSVAEATTDAVETKKVVSVLVDWRKPSGDAPERHETEKIRAEVVHVYGDHCTDAGGWVNPDRIVEDAQDPDTPWPDALRFFMNRRSTGQGSWLPDRGYLALEELPVPEKGAMVALGFDGSQGSTEHADHTGIVGFDLVRKQLFLVRHFVPKQNADGSWSINKGDVDEAFSSAFETWNVVRAYADPPYYGDFLVAWEARWPKKVVAFNTNSTVRMAPATERLHTAITDRRIARDSSPVLAEHFANAVGYDKGNADGRKIVIGKEFPQSTRKVDLAVCGVLAFEAGNDAIAEGVLNQPPAPEYAVGGF